MPRGLHPYSRWGRDRKREGDEHRRGIGTVGDKATAPGGQSGDVVIVVEEAGVSVEVLVRDRAALEEEPDEGEDDHDQPLDVNSHLGAPRILKPSSLGKAIHGNSENGEAGEAGTIPAMRLDIRWVSVTVAVLIVMAFGACLVHADDGAEDHVLRPPACAAMLALSPTAVAVTPPSPGPHIGLEPSVHLCQAPLQLVDPPPRAPALP